MYSLHRPLWSFGRCPKNSPLRVIVSDPFTIIVDSAPQRVTTVGQLDAWTSWNRTRGRHRFPADPSPSPGRQGRGRASPLSRRQAGLDHHRRDRQCKRRQDGSPCVPAPPTGAWRERAFAHSAPRRHPGTRAAGRIDGPVTGDCGAFASAMPSPTVPERCAGRHFLPRRNPSIRPDATANDGKARPTSGGKVKQSVRFRYRLSVKLLHQIPSSAGMRSASRGASR